jgi:NADH-quinone oxidoreductase subunit E
MDHQITDAILTRYPVNKREGLIPILQEIQAENGYLTEEIMERIGAHLHLPANKIYCIATFYDQFRFKAPGRCHIRICRGTACHIAGSSTYLKEIEHQLRLKAGSTSKDKNFSLEVVNCLGACDSAPIIQVNNHVFTRVTPDDLNHILRSLKEKSDIYGRCGND